MGWDSETLKHALHLDPGVYYVLPEPLSRERFVAAAAVLERHAGSKTDIPADLYWDRFHQRPPWDTLVARFSGPLKTAEDGKRYRASFQNVDNIARERLYPTYRIGDIAVTLDAFNPNNELGLCYIGAGEPVVVLLLHGMHPQVVRRQLAQRSDVYRVLRELDLLFSPSFVCGTHSWAPLAFAYAEGRLDPQIRPWEFLFELTVLDRNKLEADAATIDQTFRKVEAWPRGRVLLQVRDGLEEVLASEYPQAGRIVGRTAIQELVPNAYDRIPVRAKDILR